VTSAIIVAGQFEETLACVREQYVIVDHACCTLAADLRTGAIGEGLQAVERICVTLLVADELIGFIDRVGTPGATLSEARRVRESMVRRAAPWLAVAARDLPGAEILVRLFVVSHQGAPNGRRSDGVRA
jgi:hypothetical protein